MATEALFLKTLFADFTLAVSISNAFVVTHSLMLVHLV